MLRKSEDRDLDRKFTRIESWDEFLARWNSIDTEQEAKGLLFAGVDVPLNPRLGLLPRVTFYLKWSTHENQTISQTAEQIIVKSWLKKSRSYPFYEVDCQLLDFLQVRRESLLKPPYPRFIAEFLTSIRNSCRHGNYCSDPRLEKPIIRALLVWGLGYELAGYGNRKALPVIEEFLRENKCDPGDALMKISGFGEPIPDLSSPVVLKEINDRASLALLKLRYWVGEGVNEKYRR